jgi:hypothetical protein
MWVVIAVAVAICALWYALARPDFPHLQTQAATGPFIISLNDTVKDAQGIPYSGTVLYNSVSGAYSYIATQDEGTVAPVSPSAFSSGTYYLAVRTGASTTHELVLYDYQTLSLVRVIKELSLGEAIQSAVWAPDGKTFAYLPAGVPSPELMIDSVVPSASARALGFYIPVGFSPDGMKLLSRGTSTPLILSAADGTRTQVSGIAPPEPTAWMMTSHSGKYVVIASGKEAQWYAINWDAASFDLLGTVTLTSDTHDMLFAPDDSLIVRQEGSDVAKVYAYDADKGVKLASSIKLQLPKGSHLLHIPVWQ